MNKKFNFSISDYRRKLQTSILLLFLVFFAYVFVPYIVADVNATTRDASATVNWAPISLTLSDGGDVAFGDIVPSSNDGTQGGNVGTMKVLKKNISITSNGKSANVYLSMVGNSNRLEYSYGSTTDSSISIPAVTGAGASPASFGGSGWGYAVKAKGAGEKVDPVSDMGFSPATTYTAYDSNLGKDLTKASDVTIYNTGKWKGVPAFGAPDTIWSATTENPKGFGGEGDKTLNNFEVYYAAMVGTDVIAGTYKNSVVYTALASSTDIDGVSNNINVSNLSSGGKYAANGDKIRLEFDLAQSESGAVSRDKVHIYLLPHDLMVSNGYTLTDEIRTAATAESGSAYPTCAIGNASGDFVITGDGTTGAAINCVVSGATIADADKVGGSYTDDLDGDGYKDGYYDVWVYINNGFELDYVSKRMSGEEDTMETLAFVGLQSKEIVGEAGSESLATIITEMQEMDTGICHSTNKWTTKTGDAARVTDPSGNAITGVDTMAKSIALGVGTFRLKDNRDNKYYLVRHLADGNCWMVQNLDLELGLVGTDATHKTLTKDNTDLNTKVNYDPGATVAALSGADTQEKLKAKFGSISTCSSQFQPKGTNGGGCRWGSGLSQNSTTNDGGTTYEFDTGALAHKIDGTVENSDSTNWRPKNRSFLPNGQRNNSAEPLTGSKDSGNNNAEWVENNGNAEYPRSYDNGYDYIERTAGTWTGNSTHITNTTALDKDSLTPNGDNAETQYEGHYYNWYAATAESGKFADINTSSQAADSICPKGWQLPANHTADSTKSWENLLKTTYWGDAGNRGGETNFSSETGAAMLHKMPLSVIFSGDYNWVNGNLNYRGSYGYYWSSTPNSYYYSYHLYFLSTYVNPQYYYNKPGGFTVRCVAR